MIHERGAAAPTGIVAFAACLVMALAGPIAAQTAEAPAVPSQPAGWTLTPTLGVSSAWDDNPLVASEGNFSPGDYVTAVRSGLTTGRRGRRSAFTLAYNGSFDFYRELRGRDTQDHRGSLDFSHQLTRRVSIFAHEQALYSPTTGDAAELGVAVLRRRTTRMNTFRTGFDATLARHTTLTAAYATQWVDFEKDESDLVAPSVLLGGHSHGGSASLRQQISPRVAIGGDYDARRALVGPTHEVFDVQSALAAADVVLARHVEASFAFGQAWLFTGDGVRRSGPTFRLGLEWRGRRADGSVRYSRALLPSFGFGGTFQNEELRGDLHIPFGRWFAWSSGLAATNSDPLVEGELGLRGTWAQSALAVTVKRKLRLEAFGSHVFQESTSIGGRVHRTRVGVQASVATTVRAR